MTFLWLVAYLLTACVTVGSFALNRDRGDTALVAAFTSNTAVNYFIGVDDLRAFAPAAVVFLTHWWIGTTLHRKTLQ